MLVSLAWIKSLLPGLPDAATVARVLTSRGLTVDAIAGEGADAVLDVDVPANRPDALGHLGVAREVAAGLGLPFEPAYEPRRDHDARGLDAAEQSAQSGKEAAVLR